MLFCPFLLVCAGRASSRRTSPLLSTTRSLSLDEEKPVLLTPDNFATPSLTQEMQLSLPGSDQSKERNYNCAPSSNVGLAVASI